MCPLSRVHVHLSGHRFADAYSAALEVQFFPPLFFSSLFVLTAASAGSQLRVRSADDNRARSSRYVTAYCIITCCTSLCCSILINPFLHTIAALYDELHATEDSFYSAGLVAIMCKSFLCAFDFE